MEMDTLDNTLLNELSEREERYRSVTETSPDAIITTTSEGQILTINNAGQTMFGYGVEIIGKNVEIMVPAHLREAHRKGVKRYLATRVPHIIGKKVELSALKADGTIFPIELTLSSWDGAEGIFFGSIIRDISERKRIEILKEDVTHMMRHDLRSPLVGIIGLANRLAVAVNLDAKQTKSAATISELGKKMLEMLDRSRDFYQLEEGTYELQPKPVNLFETVKQVIDQLEGAAATKGVEINIAKAPKEANILNINGEPILLENMLTNLIKNAVEASPADRNVTVSFFRTSLNQAPAWRIDIHNEGAIPLEIQPHFFDAYVTSGKVGGFGLGTHNAMIVTRAHGGEISFTSNESHGTHLLVDLPA
ncbi:MAG: PAS domain-containing sensor histidine kinase [Deltaproteobacteria bacterium]|nr:PAS domain-containing sensor histidine kinase [Deltaproteobacteria bacterium]